MKERRFINMDSWHYKLVGVTIRNNDSWKSRKVWHRHSEATGICWYVWTVLKAMMHVVFWMTCGSILLFIFGYSWIDVILNLYFSMEYGDLPLNRWISGEIVLI